MFNVLMQNVEYFFLLLAGATEALDQVTPLCYPCSFKELDPSANTMAHYERNEELA